MYNILRSIALLDDLISHVKGDIIFSLKHVKRL